MHSGALVPDFSNRLSPTRRRSPDILASGLAAVALLLGGCRQSPDGNAPTKPAAAAVSVTVAHPVARQVEDWNEFIGRLAAPETVEIRSRVSGYLAKVHFQEGSLVQPSDLLVTIDPRPYQAVVDRLAADLSRAKHRADLAAAEASRADSLFRTRAISADDHDQRIKASAEAVDSVRGAEAALQAAKLDLEFTEIRSPIAGRISNARVTAGNLVSGGDSGGTLLTTVVSIDPIHCYVDLDERSALRYRTLDPARTNGTTGNVAAWMALTDESGFPREGRVDFVDNQLNATTGTLRLRAVFPNPDGRAAPGYFARVRLPGSGVYEGLLIRDSAVGSDQGRPFVLVAQPDDTAGFRPVVLGPLLEGLRVVRSGLAPTDQVVLTGLMTARPGSPLRTQLVPMMPVTTNSVGTAARP
jgi:RND family efflux transporter MFP subunit